MGFKIGTFGISFSLGSDKEQERTTSRQPNQENPVDCYVYGHYDNSGNLFYVGKGTGRRAWSDDRHLLWKRYVANHLNGSYTVKIIADGLTDEQAERMEDGLITEHGTTLVNWINFGRLTDFKVLDEYHAHRNANRKLIAETKKIEATNPENAIENYRTAIQNISTYAFLNYEGGLIGKLMQEEADEGGRNGELEALDRLTLCLCKLGQGAAAKEAADSYFAMYKRDLVLKGAEKVLKRVEKAAAKTT
ncbi:MAG: hypothetical protein HY853_05425 [Burkholderiales bacterium]|nr:hypothetical protein [Burkholderiales bacterium]